MAEERKLATIRIVSDISPIEGADRIVKASIDGWEVVILKDEFKISDQIIYCEIDSFIPHDIAPYLSKGKEPKLYKDTKGERLRSVRLRGQLSQGLILPISILEKYHLSKPYELGQDVTDILGILKYEKDEDWTGNWTGKGKPPGNPKPDFIPPSRMSRVQNVPNIPFWTNVTWEITEKLDGSAMNIYLSDKKIGISSMNVDLPEPSPDEKNMNQMWKLFNSLNIREQLLSMNKNLIIQGEIIGPKIQKNKYGLTEHQFFVYNIYSLDELKNFSSETRINLTNELKLNHCPILEIRKFAPDEDIKQILNYAIGPSKLHNIEREGVVFKCITGSPTAFKAISNSFLLKYGW